MPGRKPGQASLSCVGNRGPPSVSASTSPFIHPSIQPSIHPSSCTSISLSVHPVVPSYIPSSNRPIDESGSHPSGRPDIRRSGNRSRLPAVRRVAIAVAACRGGGAPAPPSTYQSSCWQAKILIPLATAPPGRGGLSNPPGPVWDSQSEGALPRGGKCAKVRVGARGHAHLFPHPGPRPEWGRVPTPEHASLDPGRVVGREATAAVKGW